MSWKLSDLIVRPCLTNYFSLTLCMLDYLEIWICICIWYHFKWTEYQLIIGTGCPVLYMMTSSNGNIFCVTGPLCGEFTGQRPVTRSFDVFFDLRLNKQLSKQWWDWWFEMPSSPLWCHCNGLILDNSYGFRGFKISHEIWIVSAILLMELVSGPHLNIKIFFPRYGDFHVIDKTVERPSYLWHGDPYIGILYWDGPQFFPKSINTHLCMSDTKQELAYIFLSYM